MNKLGIQLLLLGFCLSSIGAQNILESDVQKARAYAHQIDSNDLKRHLYFLASDDLKGRETGEEGNLRAAEYIASFMQKNELLPLSKQGAQELDLSREAYFQKINFQHNLITKNVTILGNDSLEVYQDFVMNFPSQSNKVNETFDRFYFAGYGVEDEAYNDFGNFIWKNQAVFIYDKIPEKLQNTIIDSNQLDLSVRLKNLEEKGVRTVFIIHDAFRMISARMKRMQLSKMLTLPQESTEKYFSIGILNPSSAKKMLDSEKKFLKYKKQLLKKGGLQDPKPFYIDKSLKMNWEVDKELVQSQNIIGYIPGTEQNIEKPYLVVSAHFDHLGVRAEEVYNGADDNASGTTTLLELMETFAEAKANGFALQRSIVFMFMTGEEKGLLGSKYYTENPIWPLDQCLANVNIDMVGRVDEKYSDSSNYIYVIGADRISQDLHDIHTAINDRGPRLALDFTYNAEDDPNRYYYRSDHYNFAKHGIPAIFFFNGTHDDYHRITDTPDKIAYSKMKARVELFFMTIWELANRRSALKINKAE